MSTPEDHHVLVMPFVTVASRGGPHDDQAYVCGYEMGGLTAILAMRLLPVHRVMIHAVNAAQADLIAMDHGYTWRADPVEDMEWLYATFHRIEREEQR